MAIIDRQIQDRIVSRGLGAPSSVLDPEESLGYNERAIETIIIVREEKEYYPATGTYSTEEED